MRVFKVPFDIKREEKIFGGYLSLRQVTYLMLSAGSFAICAFNVHIAIKIIFITCICIFFLLCAFLKIGEQNFDKFFFYWIKFLFRNRNFIYERSSQ